jgi:AAHS family 4-hydroxybenzoate transporter-like MFS transporter
MVDVSRIIDEQRIGSFNLRLLAFSFLVMMTDGYDIGAAAYAGPALIKEWGLERAALSPLFSAGLVAGLFGPLLFGYLSDRYGRKRVIVGGAVFFGIFTLASVWAHSLDTLIYLRFIAGLGISGTLPIVVALNNEFAPARFRATLIVVMFMGVTFGGGLPGLVAARYMSTHGWQILFWIGGLAPIVAGILVAFALPESIKFLSLRPERRAELVKLLARLRPSLLIAAGSQFHIGGETNLARFSFRSLFAGSLAWITPLFWISSAVNLMVFYFVNQWTPVILTGTGVSVERAAIATALFQFGGTLGGLAIMRPLDRYGFLPVPILFGLAIPIVASIGAPGLPEPAVMALITAAGFCLLGLQFGNIACESQVYPTFVRSWGVGSCFAAGRVGSVLGPLIGGMLIGTHMPMRNLFYIVSIPLGIGLLAAIALTPRYRTRMREMAMQ